MRASPLATVTLPAVLALVAPPVAQAEIRTDRLSGGERKAWKQIVGIVMAVDSQERPLHPTLRQLWREVESSPHVLHIELRRLDGSSAIAGRFRVEAQGPDGRLEATLILNLRVIDRVLTGSPDAQLVPFEVLGQAARRAQVLGHELAHAAWAFAAPEQARQAFEAQVAAERLAFVARTVGTAAPGFGERVEASARLIRRLEEPALAAEAAVAAELRHGRKAHRALEP